MRRRKRRPTGSAEAAAALVGCLRFVLQQLDVNFLLWLARTQYAAPGWGCLQRIASASLQQHELNMLTWGSTMTSAPSAHLPSPRPYLVSHFSSLNWKSVSFTNVLFGFPLPCLRFQIQHLSIDIFAFQQMISVCPLWSDLQTSYMLRPSDPVHPAHCRTAARPPTFLSTVPASRDHTALHILHLHRKRCWVLVLVMLCCYSDVVLFAYGQKLLITVQKTDLTWCCFAFQ